MPHKKLSNDMPATYRIRVQGSLAESWSDRLGGLTITTTGQTGEAPVTTLGGQLRDQADRGVHTLENQPVDRLELIRDQGG